MLTFMSANSCCNVCGWAARSGNICGESMMTESEIADSNNSSGMERAVSLVEREGKLAEAPPLHACV